MILLGYRHMPDWLALLPEELPPGLAEKALRATLILLVGFLLARLLSRLGGRIAQSRSSEHVEMITRRLVFYTFLALSLVMALDALGVDLGVLLGAAGILTVALGFAAQTSASNLISGVFLLSERPFSVGETIEVDGTVGEVLSVDLLSVKLRTFENLFVRVPNEAIIKSQIINMSRNPIRRIEIELRVAYTQDLDSLRSLLRSLAVADPDIFEEPEPTVWVDRLGDSAIHVQFLAWAANQSAFFDIRSRLLESVARALQQHRVEIGYQKVEVGRDEPGPAIGAGVVKPPTP